MTAGPVDADLAETVRGLASARVGVREQRAAIAAALDTGALPDPRRVVERLARELRRGDAGDSPTRLGAGGGGGGDPDRVLVAGCDGYPRRLADAWPELGAPLWLFVRGPAAPPTGGGAEGAAVPDHHGGTPGLPALGPDRPAVAIVGTRQATADGLRTAHELAAACARAGATVVSGLARGIDQAAHRGALSVDGATVAVLGTGFGVDYPRGDGALRTGIERSGGLVTELAPGAPPRPSHFLARNRIIAGLADVTVVVEGRERSGALHTARMAAAQGREVWAVPGSLHAPRSRAPLALIRDGAAVVTAVDDVVHALGLDPGADGTAQEPVGRLFPPGLTSEDHAVWSLTGPVPVSIDELVTRTGYAVTTVLRCVGRLARQGLVVAGANGVVAAPRDPAAMA